MSETKQEEKNEISNDWISINIDKNNFLWYKQVTTHLTTKGFAMKCTGFVKWLTGNKKEKKQEPQQENIDDNDDLNEDGYYVVDKIAELINIFVDFLPTTKSLRQWQVLDTIFSLVERNIWNEKNDEKNDKNNDDIDIIVKEENKENEIKDNENNKICLENKRIIRLSINNKLLKCLTVIFNQTISKLNFLNENDFYQLINQFKNDINNSYKEMNNDINKFVEQFIKTEYSLQIENEQYIGSVIVKFKKDNNNDNKIYVACHALTQKNSANNNEENIKNEIDSTHKNI